MTVASASKTNRFGIDTIDRMSGEDGKCDFCTAQRVIFAVKKTDGSWKHGCSECAEGARTMP
jgi:hypothetical protein